MVLPISSILQSQRLTALKSFLQEQSSPLNRPTTAQRCRSGTEKNTLEDLLSSVLSQFKKNHPSENLKFNYLGIFKSSKLRILMGKSFEFILS